MSRKPEEKRSSSKLANTENKSDKGKTLFLSIYKNFLFDKLKILESEQKQASKKETKKIEGSLNNCLHKLIMSFCKLFF